MISAPRVSCVALVAGCVALTSGLSAPARAQEMQGDFSLFGLADAQTQSRADLDRLADEVRLHPTDYEKTYAFIQLASQLGYDEEAISALQRLLMFNPNLARARKELGSLYAKLGADRSAELQMRRALEFAKSQLRAKSADRGAIAGHREGFRG